MAVTPLPACGEIVRRYDPDRFMLSLLAPRAVREDVWAVYAFNHEIAKTREIVTETRLGLIRLQWWRDAIAGVYRGEVPAGQPILSGLASAIAKHNLPQDVFDHLIYAREFDLEDRMPANLAGVIKYAEYTSAPLLDLTQRMTAPEAAGDVAGIAIGYALTGILRATPVHLSQRRCYLPQDRLPHIHQHFDGKDIDELAPVVKDMVDAAWQHLADSPRLAVPKVVRAHRKLAHMWLKKIEFAGYDLFSPAMQVPPFMREIRLLFS